MQNPHPSHIDQLRQMASGYARTQELYTAIRLGIADRLAGGPKDAQDLAELTGAHPRSLFRFLRVLAARGLVSPEENGTFSLTQMGQYLRSDHPQSLYDLILYTGEIPYRVGEGMLFSVKTGQPAFEQIFGMPFFDYLTQNPETGSLFNRLSSLGADDRAAGVVSAYDFSGSKTIVDIGGGNGTLLAAILRAYPHPRGIVFDAPGVIQEAQERLSQGGLGSRLETVAGDFFKDRIPSADLYIMSNIIHDWDDDHASRILTNCRASMQENSRLLLIEQIMPERVNDAPAAAGSDFTMLLLLHGSERTEEEYSDLLSRTGLEINAILPIVPAKIFDGRKPSWAIIECKHAGN